MTFVIGMAFTHPDPRVALAMLQWYVLLHCWGLTTLA